MKIVLLGLGWAALLICLHCIDRVIETRVVEYGTWSRKNRMNKTIKSLLLLFISWLAVRYYIRGSLW